MDEFLSKAGSQAVSFAIKSGISIASSFAIKKISNFIVQIPQEDATKLELLRTQLETRIEIVSSALDLIKLVAARGNTNLGYTLNLTQGLRKDIDEFDNKVSELFKDIEDSSTNSKKQASKIKSLEVYMVNLLKQIENVTPFINLSLTTSGANLNSTLSKSVSPSLLLNASKYVIESNKDVDGITSVGPTFEVTLYTIFYNSSNVENPITWKETMKRANIIINRVKTKSSKSEFDYTISIKQNFDDGRYHDEDEMKETEGLTLHIEQIKRLVFNVSGRLLRLEENDNPVLVLKTESDSKSSHSGETKWYAFGSYDPPELSESEEEEDGETCSEEEFKDASETSDSSEVSKSVALLEYIFRLTSLQHDDEKSLLNITDERLSLYLNDENAHAKTKQKQINIEEVINALKNMNLE